MRDKIRGGLTYANVMSTLAVFLILAGGSALAVDKLKRNSVGSKQIRTNAVKVAEISDGAVAGGEIADGAVGASDLNGSLLSSLKDSCPAGMTRLGNAVCFDTVSRGTGSQGTAIITCAAAGLRLPSASEGYLAFGVVLGTDEVWTDILYDNGTTANGDGIDEGVTISAGTYEGVASSSTHHIRCATPPSEG